MPTIIFSRCGKCKKRLSTEDGGAFSEIGIPFIDCPECGCVNLRNSRKTEWAMASTLTKIECYGYVPLLGGLVGAGGGGLIQSFVEAVLKYFNLPPTGVNSPWFWMAGGVIVGCFIFWKMLVNVIRESQKRMSDANYVARLKELRLL